MILDLCSKQCDYIVSVTRARNNCNNTHQLCSPRALTVSRWSLQVLVTVMFALK